MRTLLAIVLALSFAVAAFAQPSMEIPAEVKKLEWMNGDWAGSFNWVQEGMKADGKMKFSCSFDGQFQFQKSEIEMMGMKMTESGYLGYDAKKKKYFLYTFSNFSPYPRVEWGNFEGTNKMIFISEPWDSGQGEPTTSRSTVTKVDNDNVDFVLEFKMADKWTKVAEGKFKRVK